MFVAFTAFSKVKTALVVLAQSIRNSLALSLGGWIKHWAISNRIARSVQRLRTNTNAKLANCCCCADWVHEGSAKSSDLISYAPWKITRNLHCILTSWHLGIFSRRQIVWLGILTFAQSLKHICITAIWRTSNCRRGIPALGHSLLDGGSPFGNALAWGCLTLTLIHSTRWRPPKGLKLDLTISHD
jgi:hypothetical protein